MRYPIADTFRDMASVATYRLILLPWFARSSRVHAHVRFHTKAQFMPQENIGKLQIESLRSIIAHARKHVPWYRRAYEPLALSDSFPQCLEDLRVLPFVRRCDLQHDASQFVSELTTRECIGLSSTGGSSGQPVSFHLSLREIVVNAATETVVNRMAGYRGGMRVGRLWGAPSETEHRTSTWRNRVGEWAWNIETFNAYTVSPQIWDGYHKRLEQWRPHVLECYAGAASAFAQHLENRGIQPQYPRLTVICSAETLTERDRDIIVRVFRKPVQNRYGCRELGALAAECEYQRGLHTLPGAFIIEVIDPDTGLNAPEGEGELVITSLTRRDVPWIRYRIGDWGQVVLGAHCPCGRTTPRIVNLRGRVMDMLRATNGNRIHGSTLNPILWSLKGLLAYQIEQVTKAKLVIRIKASAAFKKDNLQPATDQIRRLMGSDCLITYEFVEEIPLTPLGKRRFVINRLTD